MSESEAPRRDSHALSPEMSSRGAQCGRPAWSHALAPLRACLSPGCWHPAITPTQQRASAALSGYTEAEHDKALGKLIEDMEDSHDARRVH